MSSKGSCKESVLQYLIKQNRPYSANDVLQNLHKEFGKTAIQKALDDLSVECKIREKVYGKQKVYSVIQEEENSAEEMGVELVKLDSEIQEITDKLRAAEQELKKVETELKDLENAPSTVNALAEKNELEKTIANLSDKIESLSKTTLAITEEEKKNILTDHENLTRQYKKRKQMCMDIVNSILESYPKKIQVLMEEIGIETDEDAQK